MTIKILRRISQCLVLSLIIAIPLLNLRGRVFITGTIYSFAIGPLWMTEPLSALQVMVASLSVTKTLIVSALIPVAASLIFGRIFCGWLCPQNMISEFIDYINEKLKIKRVFRVPPTARPRYIFLAFLLLMVPIAGFPIANLIFAPGIISTQSAKYIYEARLGVEAALIVLIAITEVFLLRRAWCNYVCPAGSLYGLMRFRRTLKVVYKEDAEHPCGRCLECARACRLGLDPMSGKIYPQCHNCGDCIVACKKIQRKGSPLSFKF